MLRSTFSSAIWLVIIYLLYGETEMFTFQSLIKNSCGMMLTAAM